MSPTIQAPVVMRPAPGNHRFDLTPLEFRLQLDARVSLFTVMVTVSRLGGEVSSMITREIDVEMTVLAPPQTVHRFERVLAEVVGVVSIATIPAGTGRGTEIS